MPPRRISLSLSLSLTLELIKYLMKWRKYRSISLLQYNSVRVTPLSHRAAIRHPAPRSRCVCCVAIHHLAPCSYLAHHQSRMSLLSPLTHCGFTRSCPALGARTDGHISTRDASAPRFFLERTSSPLLPMPSSPDSPGTRVLRLRPSPPPPSLVVVVADSRIRLTRSIL
jgi:hypothetical protein